MRFWQIIPNYDGSFTLFEDPLGEAKAGGALGVIFIVCMAVLIAPVFTAPAAFLPCLACFLLALFFRFFFCGGNNLFFLCPLYLPFAAYSFVVFSETMIANEDGELLLIAIPVILLAAVLFAVLSAKLMADDPDDPGEFSLFMVLLFGLTLGIAAPVAGLGMGNGTVVFYALRVLYILTAVLLVRAVVMFFKALIKGNLHPGAMLINLIMLAVGCGVYLVMCLFGAIFGDFSGILCLILFATITVIYSLVFKKQTSDGICLRFVFLPTALIAVLNCFGGAELPVKDDLIYPLSQFLGGLHIIPRLAELFGNVSRSFAVLFAGAAELILRIIEKVFDCSIGTPRLPDFVGMVLGIIALGLVMVLTRGAVEGMQRRKAAKCKVGR